MKFQPLHNQVLLRAKLTTPSSVITLDSAKSLERIDFIVEALPTEEIKGLSVGDKVALRSVRDLFNISSMLDPDHNEEKAKADGELQLTSANNILGVVKDV